jgi:methionine-rich copper-binding protein CopC
MFRAGFILFVLGLLICSTPAGAHARFDHASPAAGSNVSSPSEVTLYFTEQLEPKFSGAEVRNADGERVDRGSSISGKVMHVSIGALPPGTYNVSWHVLSVDTHKTQASFSFEQIIPQKEETPSTDRAGQRRNRGLRRSHRGLRQSHRDVFAVAAHR